MMGGIYLLLGSNQGDKRKHVTSAIAEIEKLVKVLRSSSLYESAPWGNSDQGWFLNQVLEIDTNLRPERLLQELQDLERNLGRKKIVKWGPRIIDIDILFYRSQIVNSSKLVIPHPGIQDRKFTLFPLMELSPNLVHPVLNKTIKELLDQCEDPLEVRQMESNID